MPRTSFKEMMDRAEITWGTLVGTLLIAGGAFIAAGYGMATRKRWGRTLALFLATMVAVLIIAGLFSGRLQIDPCIFVGIAVYCLCCYSVLFRGPSSAEFK